jgi:hypothetical protein
VIAPNRSTTLEKDEYISGMDKVTHRNGNNAFQEHLLSIQDTRRGAASGF